jgi:hypothetical protein
MLLCLVALYLEVRVLVECYRENKERKCQRDECPAKPDKATRGNFGKLGGRHKYLGLALGNLRIGIDVCRSNACNFFLKARNFCLKKRRFAHRPNENKISHRWRRRV